jgi:O-antigen/teichoic acid export membrane protein
MKKQLISDSFIYLLVTVIQSGAQFLMLPYLTRSLSIDEYANAELFLTAYGLFNLIIIFGSNTNVYKDFASNKELNISSALYEYRVSIYRFLFLNSIFLLIACLILRLFAGERYDYIVYASVCSVLYSYYIIESCIYQIKKRSILILKLTIFFVCSNTLITILLIEVNDLGFESRAAGYILSSFVIFMFLLRKGGVKITDVSSFPHGYKSTMLILFPLFISSIFSWVAESSDKIVIAELLSLNEVAIYAVGYKFGMVILLLTVAYSRAWMPYVIENIDSKYTILKGVLFSTVLLILLMVFYFVIVTFVYDIIVPEEYLESIVIVYIVGGAYAVDGISKLINSVFLGKGKTNIYVVINIIAGVLNFILNLTLIPIVGYVGAAYATLVAFTVSALISSFYYYKLYITSE